VAAVAVAAQAPHSSAASLYRLRFPLAAEAGVSAVDKAALDYATSSAKLDHIFSAKHNFDPLEQQFGSREAVVQQLARICRVCRVRGSGAVIV